MQLKIRVHASFMAKTLTAPLSSVIANEPEFDLALPFKLSIGLYTLGIRNANITRILKGVRVIPLSHIFWSCFTCVTP